MSKKNIPLWRDEHSLQLLGQIIFVISLAFFFFFIYANMQAGLQKQGTTVNFAFITGLAGFDIGESLIAYSRESSYLQAFAVGLLNTLFVSLVGIFFSTILGVLLGVARLSSNFLVNRLAAFYLEAMRNLSLLVFLIFWYLGVLLKLPKVKEAILWPGQILLTNRGIGIPWGIAAEGLPAYRWILAFGLMLAIALAFLLYERGRRTGRPPLTAFWALLTFAVVALAGWLLLPQPPFIWDFPYVKGLNLAGGKILSPEFMALASGLTLYTAAFIGEVVRAGIQSVSKGQVEAARALGFNGFQTLRLIVFPQALRVIVPPLTSQYLNLAKNSSLAVAIGYPDLFYVSSTIINQSGRAVEMITLVMLTYLALSLLTSAFMNWYNQKIRLVER